MALAQTTEKLPWLQIKVIPVFVKVCPFVTAILISLTSERIVSIQTFGSIFLAANSYAAILFFKY